MKKSLTPKRVRAQITNVVVNERITTEAGGLALALPNATAREIAEKKNEQDHRSVEII